jgi:hypothetical protein
MVLEHSPCKDNHIQNIKRTERGELNPTQSLSNLRARIERKNLRNLKNKNMKIFSNMNQMALFNGMS